MSDRINSRLGLLADIHANEPALRSVLDTLDEQGVRQVLVLGDLVGYGPHPAEVIALIRERQFSVLMGNHDFAVGNGNYYGGLGDAGKISAMWTRARLDASELEWLRSLPRMYRGDIWLAVHGSPISSQFIRGYVDLTTYRANLDWLAAHRVRLCFHGHTHVSRVYFRRRGEYGYSDDRLQLLGGYEQAYLCPGSVGQPREGHGTEARYGIFDLSDGHLELRSVPYDIEKTLVDMSRLGLPEGLMRRLAKGK